MKLAFLSRLAASARRVANLSKEFTLRALRRAAGTLKKKGRPSAAGRTALCLLLLLLLLPAAGAKPPGAGSPALADASPPPSNAASAGAPARAVPPVRTAPTPTAARGASAAALPSHTAAASPADTPAPSASTAAAMKKPAMAAGTPRPSPSPRPPRDNALLLRVYKGSQCVVALRVEGGAETAVRVMICSTGKTYGRTPDGTFKITSKYKYHQLKGYMGQYCSRFNGSILFHSVPIDNGARTMAEGKSRMKLSYYSQLGSMASSGCVRLLVRDALWIYSNCPAGTVVEVVGGASPWGGGGKPALKPGPPYTSEDGAYGWDPTDPDPANPYRNEPEATAEPTPTPAPVPTPEPTPAPTEPPAPEPTASPTPEPTPAPSPSPAQTEGPTASPAIAPTETA